MTKTLEHVKCVVQAVFLVRENGKVVGETAIERVVFADQWAQYATQQFPADQKQAENELST